MIFVFQSVTVKGKNRTEAERVEREAQDNAEHEDWWFPDDVGSNNSGYYILQELRLIFSQTILYFIF